MVQRSISGLVDQGPTARLAKALVTGPVRASQRWVKHGQDNCSRNWHLKRQIFCRHQLYQSYYYNLNFIKYTACHSYVLFFFSLSKDMHTNFHLSTNSNIAGELIILPTLICDEKVQLSTPHTQFSQTALQLIHTPNCCQSAWVFGYKLISRGSLPWYNSKIIIVLLHSSNQELPHERSCPSPMFTSRCINIIEYGLEEPVSLGRVEVWVQVWVSKFSEHHWFLQFLIPILYMGASPVWDVFQFVLKFLLMKPAPSREKRQRQEGLSTPDKALMSGCCLH